MNIVKYLFYSCLIICVYTSVCANDDIFSKYEKDEYSNSTGTSEFTINDILYSGTGCGLLTWQVIENVYNKHKNNSSLNKLKNDYYLRNELDNECMKLRKENFNQK